MIIVVVRKNPREEKTVILGVIGNAVTQGFMPREGAGKSGWRRQRGRQHCCRGNLAIITADYTEEITVLVIVGDAEASGVVC